MKINYNVTGAERKSLVGAISTELNAPAEYLGAPTFAYKVGGYHIDKTGLVTGDDNWELVADLQGLHDFTAVETEYDSSPHTVENDPAFEDLDMTAEEELGPGRQHRENYAGENGMQVSDVPERDGLVIEIPLTGFTPDKIDNLLRLVSAKAPLLKAALGTDDLQIQQTGDTLRFPWFPDDTDGVRVKAFTHLVTALCDMAKNQQRVTATEKDTDNEKFAFRCFLLRLGFIGPDYKDERKVLLANLTGSSAFKNGSAKADEDATCTE